MSLHFCFLKENGYSKHQEQMDSYFLAMLPYVCLLFGLQISLHLFYPITDESTFFTKRGKGNDFILSISDTCDL